ncbi:hypothetical protein B0H15DRAFT_950963 [Mycena belliarum]|uniref:Uncharacterized protein n=1 Tax=Mycena belliarum TaxID=1033014 RepID=A0AAD6XMN7_9AGAR|nr:hypothetical protein B0H15DRAFT_950963 [Mycena belliae]
MPNKTPLDISALPHTARAARARDAAACVGSPPTYGHPTNDATGRNVRKEEEAEWRKWDQFSFYRSADRRIPPIPRELAAGCSRAFLLYRAQVETHTRAPPWIATGGYSLHPGAYSASPSGAQGLEHWAPGGVRAAAARADSNVGRSGGSLCPMLKWWLHARASRARSGSCFCAGRVHGLERRTVQREPPPPHPTHPTHPTIVAAHDFERRAGGGILRRRGRGGGARGLEDRGRVPRRELCRIPRERRRERWLGGVRAEAAVCATQAVAAAVVAGHAYAASPCDSPPPRATRRCTLVAARLWTRLAPSARIWFAARPGALVAAA